MRTFIQILILFLFAYTNLYAGRGDLNRCLLNELHHLDKRYSAPRAISESELDLAARKVIEEYRNRQILDEAHNAKFIALKDDPKSGIKLYQEVENAITKRQNDIDIKDKDLVTAMENLYKQRYLDEVASDPLLSQHLIAQYSDFKSLRLAYNSDSPEVVEAISALYKRVAIKYEDELHGLGLDKIYHSYTDISGDPKVWHLSGIGKTADEASLYARDMRRRYHEGMDVGVASSETSKEFLEELVSSLEKKRASVQLSLLKTPSGRKALEKSGVGDKLIFNADANDIFRKAKGESFEEYSKEIRDGFYDKFRIKLDDQTIKLMRNYYQESDLFSPSIYSVKRVILPIDQAPKSVLSIDLAGQGARNATEVQRALVKSKNSVEEITKSQRNGELLASKEMQERIDEVIDSVKKSYQQSNTKLVLSDGELGSVYRERGIDTSFYSNADKKRFKENIVLTPDEMRSVIASRTYHSGDDIVYLPKETLKASFNKEFHQSVGKLKRGSEYRPVYLSERTMSGKGTIDPVKKSGILSDGETVEKELRKIINRDMSFEMAKKRSIFIEMVGGNGNERTARVVVSGGKVLRSNYVEKIKSELMSKIAKMKMNGDLKIESIEFGD